MGLIDDIFKKSLDNLLNPENAIQYIYDNCLRKKRLELNETQKNILRNIKSKRGSVKFSIDFTEDQILESDFNNEEEIQTYLNQIFSTDDLLDEYQNKIIESTPDVVLASLKVFVKSIKNTLYSTADEMIENNHKHLINVKDDIKEKYSKELRILKMVLQILTEGFESSNSESKKDDPKIESIIRILGESILVSNEILVLVENGYSDGALSRWRNLYEQASIALFISQKDKNISERFLKHLHIDNYKSMELYNEHYKDLQVDPYSKQEIIEITELKDNYIKEYSIHDLGDYGWASTEFNLPKNKQVRFYHIENESGIKFLKPYYKLACSRVHHNSKGIFWKMGLKREHQGNILYGPSTQGQYDPIQLTVLCLLQIAISKMHCINSYDNIFIVKLIESLYDDIRDLIGQAGKY